MQVWRKVSELEAEVDGGVKKFKGGCMNLQNWNFSQCPQSGGPAVHWARSWYHSLSREWIESPCDEFSSEGFQIPYEDDQTDVAKTLMVFPNPNLTGSLNLRYGSEFTPEVITLYNAFGQIVQTFPAPDNQLQIDTEIKGLHILRIRSEGGELLERKILFL